MLPDYGRRIVVDGDFNRTVVEVLQALQLEGMEVIGRTDVCQHLKRTPGHDFRRYLLFHAWSPDLAFEVLQRDLDAGVVLASAIAIYELADGETVVTASEPLSPFLWEQAWRREAPEMTAFADQQSQVVARVLTRLQHGGVQGPTAWAA